MTAQGQFNLRGQTCGGNLSFCPNFQVEPSHIFEARKQVWESLRTFENWTESYVATFIPVD